MLEATLAGSAAMGSVTASLEGNVVAVCSTLSSPAIAVVDALTVVTGMLAVTSTSSATKSDGTVGRVQCVKNITETATIAVQLTSTEHMQRP